MKKRFWIRFYTKYPKETPFPSWVSGWRMSDEAAVMLALVDAPDYEDAIKLVRRKFKGG